MVEAVPAAADPGAVDPVRVVLAIVARTVVVLVAADPDQVDPETAVLVAVAQGRARVVLAIAVRVAVGQEIAGEAAGPTIDEAGPVRATEAATTAGPRAPLVP